MAIATRDKLSVAKLRGQIFESRFTGKIYSDNEYIRQFLLRLENAAQVSPRLTLVPPWEMPDLEHYLQHNRFAFASLVQAVEEANSFWSKSADFVRRIESKSYVRSRESIGSTAKRIALELEVAS